MLKLNQSKTEFIVFSSKQCTTSQCISCGTHCIASTPQIRNLGVFMDSTMSMTHHVQHVVKLCYFHIRNIGRIRRYLTEKSCKILTTALVLSRLDYCNSLLLGIAGRHTSSLQRCQNVAARLILQMGKRESIKSALMDLHWLPVLYRIQFKVLVLTFRAFHGTGPQYLRDLVTPYEAPRVLRSQTKKLLTVPYVRTKTFGHRMFSYAAASLWNNLPLNLREAEDTTIFKKLLKTYFFKSAYHL